MAFKIAEGYIDVNVRYDRRALDKAAREAGDSFSKNFRKGFDIDNLFDPKKIGKQASDSGKAAGKAFSDSFSKNVRTSDISFDDRRTVSASRDVGSSSGRAFTNSFKDNLDLETAMQEEWASIRADSKKEAKKWWDQSADLSRRGILVIGTILGASAPYLGALLASGIVTAFGAGLVGLGAVVAAQSDKVRNRFDELKKNIGDSLKDAAKPMEGALVDAMDSAQDLFDVLEGPLINAFDRLSGTVSFLGEELRIGFQTWPITEAAAAFDELMRASDISGSISEIGDALGELFSIVEENPEPFGMIINGLFNIIKFLIQVTTVLSASFVGWYQIIQTWGPRITGFFKFIGEGIWQIFYGLFINPGIGGLIGDGLMWAGEVIWTGLKKIGGFFKWLYDYLVGNSIIPDLVNRIKFWWSSMKTSVYNMTVGLVKSIVNKFLELLNSVVSKAKSLKDRVVSHIKGLRDKAVSWFTSAKNTTINVVKGWVSDAKSRVKKMKDGIVGDFNELKDKVVSAVRKAKDGMGAQWNKLKSKFKGPVKYLKHPVFYNLKGIFNAVVSKVPGIGSIKSPSLAGWAKGGVLPGYQSTKKDDVLTPMRSGEGVLVPEVVKALGPEFIHGLNSLGNKGGVNTVRKGFRSGQVVPKGFAEGGIIGRFTSALKDLKSGGAGKLWDSAASSIKNLAKGYGGTGANWKALPYHAFNSISIKIKEKVTEWMKKFFEGGDGRKVVEVARKYVGTGGNPNKWTRRMGMNGLPWCGMFVDGVFEEAGASKALTGVSNPAAVRSYRSLPRVSRSELRPGDLPLYRGDDGHINIATGKGAESIGGNESNAVKANIGYLNSASSYRRPRWGLAKGFARGGVVEDLDRILAQDYKENRRTTTPFATQIGRELKGLPLYDEGGKLPHKGIGVNMSGKTEAVLTSAQWEAIYKAATRNGGDVYNVTIQADMSRIKSVEDAVRLLNGIRQTARANGSRVKFEVR